MNLAAKVNNNALPAMRNEKGRIATLSDYNLEYDELQESLNDLTLLAAKITGATVSRVNLLDAYNQWTVAQHGTKQEHMDLKHSICQYTVQQDEEFEIKDLSADGRFKERVYVTDHNLIYYYGIPLKNLNGNALGALCIMDSKAKKLSANQKEMLQLIGKEIISRLDCLKQIQIVKNKNRLLLNVNKIVAHDIRGPVGGIIGLAQLVCDQQGEMPMDEVLECINLIKVSGHSVLDLAAEILNADATEAKPTVATANTINLIQLREKILNLFAPRIKDKWIVFEVSISSETATVLFPKDKLQQIIGNLVSNAIKFTPAKGKVNVNLNLCEAELHHILFITVSDTGVGMEKEMAEIILNGPGKLTKAGTSGEIGYGLGLGLVKQLVDECKGKLTMSSQKDLGTTFKVCIPLPFT